MLQASSLRPATLQALEAAMASCNAVMPVRKDVPKSLSALFSPTPQLAEALRFAILKHRDQARRGTIVPYVTHLMAVAALVGESGGSEAEMIAGLLHDVMGDGGGSDLLEDVESRFGKDVGEIVRACGDGGHGEDELPWLDRKRAYLSGLGGASLPVLRVVCADKLHNVQILATDLKQVGPAAFEHYKGDREGTLWYYRSLARLFGALVQDEPGLDAGFRSMIRVLRETVGSLEG